MQVEDVHLQQFFSSVSGLQTGNVVDIEQGAIQVMHIDALDGLVEDGAVAFLALLERFLSLFLVGNVGEHHCETLWFWQVCRNLKPTLRCRTKGLKTNGTAGQYGFVKALQPDRFCGRQQIVGSAPEHALCRHLKDFPESGIGFQYPVVGRHALFVADDLEESKAGAEILKQQAVLLFVDCQLPGHGDA
ncbi:MAG: hypothetical protein BWY63_03822 [Chloroflexi bacterium ADurb.Bin360]|nr:MAG: hypothetical protein BWY63_03822 [Chloroflexi bacterium ADurb.Bin360]